ncbi:tRNA1(Val) (adenine(37)-N6)-methyltransferase [Rhodobiaceae bacterium]|nr:tRNA1(Val) (adenine(37)-N6)-methyltransferase [Rhodobiaceae bacterium]
MKVTDDGFLGGRLQVLQSEKGYRAGIDAVMVAAAVPAVPGDNVLDLGAGVGVASLCVASRCLDVKATGLEIQSALVETALENIKRNDLVLRARIIEGSISEKAAILADKDVAYGSFDHVMTNPPFYEADKVWGSPDESKATAHALEDVSLEEWLRVTCAMAKPKGTVTIIHRADALPDLLKGVEGKLGGLVAFPLWPGAGKEASRVLLQGIKGSRAPFKLAKGLLLHGEDGGFTPEAEAILRNGAALSVSSA